jgi:hypothetical protein
MYNHPRAVKDKIVFEPFAGSGPLGFLALALGAKKSVLLDINPRAIEFMRDNAIRNRFDPSSYLIIQGDIQEYQTDQRYDILFANPPFVPVPDGIAFPIHSNGGIDGNVFTDILLSRLSSFLKPEGEAFLTVFQLEDADGPIVLHSIRKHIPNRHVELTRRRSKSFEFDELVSEYISNVPHKRHLIFSWSKVLKKHYGETLRFNYYVIHIQKMEDHATPHTVRDYDGEKYGEGFSDHDPSNNRIGSEIRAFVERNRQR